jgi:F0F1-type ATP synthase assembly protein I
MTHHHATTQIKDENIYYIIGVLSGLFIGATLEASPWWIPILAIVGLLFTAFFLTVFVRGRADA